jgi:hypothetical protein
MPWRNPLSLPFTHLQISARVPATSGVYGIVADGECLLIGETWNLRGRLLELAVALSDYPKPLMLVIETCAEEECSERQQVLHRELIREPEGFDGIARRSGAGISFLVF